MLGGYDFVFILIVIPVFYIGKKIIDEFFKAKGSQVVRQKINDIDNNMIDKFYKKHPTGRTKK